MRNITVLLVVLLLALAVPVQAGEEVWTPAGPPGARGHVGLDQIVLDPFSPSTAVTEGAGVWEIRTAP